jgi:ferritin-like metal-binding protein YciE
MSTGRTKTIIMTLDSLTGLLVEELRDVYDAEQQLIKALPKLSKAAFNEEVTEAFNLHTEQTRQHVARLERVFQRFREKSKGKKCEGMKGMIAEAETLLAEAPKADPSVLDAALIACAQRAEHYEIATYGTLHSYARTLGADEAAKLLQQTLDEELQTDRKLSELAESAVNLDAAEADEEIQREASGQSPTDELEEEPTSRQNTAEDEEDSGEAKTTTDHDEIRRWVEERNGSPATVKGTGQLGEPGLLRIDFPGYSGKGSLEKIEWDEFFEKFESEKLAFLYQRKTKGGKRSNFNKLVSRK